MDLESGISRSVSSVYMRLITQSPHDESTVTRMTFLGGAGFVVKTNRPKKKPKFALMTFSGVGKKLKIQDSRSEVDIRREM